MDIISVYNDYLDRTGAEQNGGTSIAKFNRYSKIAELRLEDYLSGDISGVTPPEPYTTEKLRDFLSIMLKSENVQVQDGSFAKPDDYYKFDSSAIIGSYRDELCGKEVLITGEDTPIEVLDGPQFTMRSQTYIKSLRPSAKRPIGKMVGKRIETLPVDLGSVKLYYIRYPVFGEIKVKVDTVYNNEVPDEATSIDYEWDENVRNLLLYFITQQYPVATREKAFVEQNELVGKGPRP